MARQATNEWVDPKGTSVLVGGAALIVGLLASSGALAACVDNTTVGPVAPGVQIKDLIPISQGGAINSLISVIDTANTAFFAGTTAFVSSPASKTPNEQVGGIWTRGVVGEVNTENTGVSNVNLQGIPVPGSIVCETKTKQDFAGFQMGRDIGELNLGNSGWNAHYGLTAGWFNANSRDTSGGTFTGDTQVPFVGLYAAATKGSFFADGLIRYDYFDNQVSDPANGLTDQHFNAQGVAVAGNLGYRYDFTAYDRSKWFIEPSVGGVWSHTEVDPLQVSGTIIHNLLVGGGPLTAATAAFPGTVQVDDIESNLGRASVRVGTNFVSNNIAWSPFATAGIYHEFAGEVKTQQTADLLQGCTEVGLDPTKNKACNFSLSSTLTTSRLGTYGQFALGVAGQVINTGWLGYARVDYRTGEDIEGVSGNIGLRYQFNPGPTALPSLKGGPAPALYTSYNWTGFYLGGFGGALLGRHETFVPTIGATNTVKAEGYLLGGQAGYNYQMMGPWVIGIEGDIGGSNAEGGKGCPNGVFFTCHLEVDDLSSVTARLGYSWGRTLLFAKGGWAIGEVTSKATLNDPAVPAFGGPTSTTKTQSGWIVGSGAEFALTENWSAKGEWTYFDLGSATFINQLGVPNELGGGVIKADATGQAVRVGVNYHFGH